MLRNILLLAAVLMATFPSTQSIANEGKGTIGIFCIDTDGKTHQSISEPQPTESEVEPVASQVAHVAKRAAFKACLDQVVHKWEQTRTSATVRATESYKVENFDLNALLNGYDFYRDAMESAATRLRH